MAKTHKTEHKVEHNIEHTKAEHKNLEFNPMQLGITFGILKAMCLAVLALAASTLGWGSALVRTLGSVFIGYDVSFLGMLLGLLWGFACGFTGGYLFAVVYKKVGECKF